MNTQEYEEFIEALPPDIAKKVKKAVSSGMSLVHDLISSRFSADVTHEYYKDKYDKWRKLSEPG
jgi:hypothetical protein